MGSKAPLEQTRFSSQGGMSVLDQLIDEVAASKQRANASSSLEKSKLSRNSTNLG